jgi:hypothetical protein
MSVYINRLIAKLHESPEPYSPSGLVLQPLWSHQRDVGSRSSRGTESLQTLCWRGMDSNFQFRDAPPTAWAPSFGGEWPHRS